MHRYITRLSNIVFFSYQKTPNLELQNLWILFRLLLKILESCPIIITIYGDNCYHKRGNYFNKDSNIYHGFDNHYFNPLLKMLPSKLVLLLVIIADVNPKPIKLLILGP